MVGGSLFENNAEYGLGIWLVRGTAEHQMLSDYVGDLMEMTAEEIKAAAGAWLCRLSVMREAEASKRRGRELVALTADTSRQRKRREKLSNGSCPIQNYLAKKFTDVWRDDGPMTSGCTGGLDHVMFPVPM